MDYQALKDEITNDPLSVGYDGKGHPAIADLLNAKVRPVDRQSFTGGELFASLDWSEVAALSPAKQTYVQLGIQAGEIPLTRTIKIQLGTLFPDESKTRNNLIALMRQDGSRAEELGFEFITPSHVARALRS